MAGSGAATRIRISFGPGAIPSTTGATGISAEGELPGRKGALTERRRCGPGRSPRRGRGPAARGRRAERRRPRPGPGRPSAARRGFRRCGRSPSEKTRRKRSGCAARRSAPRFQVVATRYLTFIRSSSRPRDARMASEVSRRRRALESQRREQLLRATNDDVEAGRGVQPVHELEAGAVGGVDGGDPVGLGIRGVEAEGRCGRKDLRGPHEGEVSVARAGQVEGAERQRQRGKPRGAKPTRQVHREERRGGEQDRRGRSRAADRPHRDEGMRHEPDPAAGKDERHTDGRHRECRSGKQPSCAPQARRSGGHFERRQAERRQQREAEVRHGQQAPVRDASQDRRVRGEPVGRAETVDDLEHAGDEEDEEGGVAAVAVKDGERSEQQGQHSGIRGALGDLDARRIRMRAQIAREECGDLAERFRPPGCLETAVELTDELERR